MPSVKIKQDGGKGAVPKHARTRTGCLSCRSRRIKCDEQRPTCRCCARSNPPRSCSYGQRYIWEDDALMLGMCHGRTGVWSEHRKETRNIQYAQYCEETRQKPRQMPHYQGGVRSQSMQSDGTFFSGYSHSSSVISDHFMNTTVHDLLLYRSSRDGCVQQACTTSLELVDETDDELYVKATLLQLAHIHSLYNSGRLSDRSPDCVVSSTDNILLSYYDKIICTSTSLLDDSTNNPNRHAMLPLAMRSPSVYQALLMVSASEICRVSKSFELLAIQYREMVLKSIRLAIQNFDRNSDNLEELLAIVIIYCASEVCDGCKPSWATHLSCYRGLMKHTVLSSSSHSFRNTSEIYRYFRQYFTTSLVIARTVFRVDGEESSNYTVIRHPIETSSRRLCSTNTKFIERPNSDSWTSSKSLALQIPLDTIDYINPYSSTSNGLLLLINDTVDLKTQFASGEGYLKSATRDEQLIAEEVSSLRKKVIQLKERLENLQQFVPACCNEDTNLQTIVAATGEAYRLATLLLLQECWSSFLMDVPDGYFSVVDTRPKSHTVGLILDLVDEVVIRNSTPLSAAWPLWPLFIVGCCMEGDEERVHVLTLFKAAEEKVPLGNIAPARTVVQAIWKQHDLAVDDKDYDINGRMTRDNSLASNFSRRIVGGMYEWERIMESMGLKLNLA